jgi:hypothetical protein
MGAVSAEITKTMPKPASKKPGSGPGQIIAMIGKMSMAGRSCTQQLGSSKRVLQQFHQAGRNGEDQVGRRPDCRRDGFGVEAGIPLSRKPLDGKIPSYLTSLSCEKLATTQTVDVVSSFGDRLKK